VTAGDDVTAATDAVTASAVDDVFLAAAVSADFSF
jgi:hypothetical protein